MSLKRVLKTSNIKSPKTFSIIVYENGIKLVWILGPILTYEYMKMVWSRLKNSWEGTETGLSIDMHKRLKATWYWSKKIICAMWTECAIISNLIIVRMKNKG